MHVERRRFLNRVTATAAASLFRVTAAAEKPYRIDIHHHLLPPIYSTAMLALGQPPLPEWAPARSIEEMDKSGIAISVVSLGSPVAVSPDAQFVRRLARDVNEYSAKMVKDHPGRFAFSPFCLCQISMAASARSSMPWTRSKLPA